MLYKYLPQIQVPRRVLNQRGNVGKRIRYRCQLQLGQSLSTVLPVIGNATEEAYHLSTVNVYSLTFLDTQMCHILRRKRSKCTHLEPLIHAKPEPASVNGMTPLYSCLALQLLTYTDTTQLLAQNRQSTSSLRLRMIANISYPRLTSAPSTERR